MNKITVLTEEEKEKYDIMPRYIVLKCKKCGSTWGVFLEDKPDNALTSINLTCRECALRKVAEEK